MRLRTLGAAAVLAGACMAPAHAVVLTPGSGYTALDTLAAAPGGTVLASFSTPIATSAWTAYFATAVVDGPEAGTNLDFYYQISNTSGSSSSLPALLSAFFSVPLDPVGPYFATDVFQTATPLGGFLPGTQAAAYTERSTLGYIAFLFSAGDGQLDPGESSYTFIVRTNATAYDANGLVGVPGDGLTLAPAFQPAGQPPLVGPIPEPGTFALLAAGLVAVAGIGRRRGLGRAQ